MLRRKQWLLQLLSAGILLIITSARVIKDVTNETPAAEGTCFYNGTWYDEGTELPTRGLCLICHCFQGFTEPNAFTCSVIDCPWEDYHQRFPGCTPIYADRDCCPIGWECDQRVSKDPDCDCEWRYLKHYEAKGCRPVYEEKKPWRENRSKGTPKECPCPWRFDCSITDDDSIEERACIFKKQIYPIGTKINTTNPCESCSCVADYFTQAPTISCLTVECPTVYSKTPLPEGCHYVYTEGQCCPIAAECPTVQEKNLYNVPICEYKGKMYYEGEQIYPDEDPCLICLCTPQWTGVNSTSCRQHDCMLERDARKLKQGCIPIYHEKTCCPIDYHCADEDFGFPRHPNRGPSFKSEDDEDEMCSFEGRYYPIGHVLDIKHPTNCVTCTCKTPPDFTCIHSSCPPPPNNDYTNCKAVYKPHSCCPDYACEQKSNRVCPDPICHGTNCWLVKREEDGCSICRCKSRCMPCPDMCQPENPDNECSGCICQINSTALINMEESSTEIKDGEADESIGKCSKVKCLPDEKCMLTKEICDGQECELKATCEKIVLGCVREICPSDCEEIGRYEESCPICHCKDKTKGSDHEIKCKNPVCESSCLFEGRDESNCPICKCSSDSNDNKSCPLTKCRGYNCSLAINDVDCIDCTCQLPCKPRECPSGCDLDLDAIDGDGLMCGCRCKNASAALDLIYSKPVEEKCPEVACRGYNCTVSSDESSCPTCICKGVCEIPKCLAGCRLENDTTDGRCPACVCKLSRSARDNTQKECPPPTCLGYNCSVITGEDGCQQCLCESPCEEQPQCPSHCKLESTAPEGRCRACICSENTEKGEDRLETSTSPSKPTNGGIPGENVEPEKRENWDADFIPLPNKDIVPEVDNIYLLKDKNKEAEHVGDIHAYPVFGEKLESGFYMAEDSLTDPSSDNESKFEESSELKGFGDDYMEEKGFDDDEKCLFKNCPPGQKCMTRRLQCIRNPCPTIPVCIDVEPRCPIPSCAIGCMVMKWDDEVCPSCFCGIIRGAQGKVCPRVPCSGERCYNVIGDDGCPKCKCDSICIPPECPDGCWLETESSDGQCPKCSCPRRRTTTISPSSFGSSTATERPMSTTSQISTTTTQSSTSEEESKTDLSSLKESSTLPQAEDMDSRYAPSSTVAAEETTIVTTTVETTTDTIPSTTLTKQNSQPPTSTLQDTPEPISTHMPDDERTTVTVYLPMKTEAVSITDNSQTQKSNSGQNVGDSVTDLPSLGSDSGFPEFPHSAGSATTRKPSFIRKPPQTPPRMRKPSPHITGVRTTTGTHSTIVSFSNPNNLTKLTVNLEDTKSTPKPCNRKMTTPTDELPDSHEGVSHNLDKIGSEHEKGNIPPQKPTTERTPTTKSIPYSISSSQQTDLNLSTQPNVNSIPIQSQPSKNTQDFHQESIHNASPQHMISDIQQMSSSLLTPTQSRDHQASISNLNPVILDDIVSALHSAELTQAQSSSPVHSHQITNNHQPSSFQEYQNNFNQGIQNQNIAQEIPQKFQTALQSESQLPTLSNQQPYKPLQHINAHPSTFSSHIQQPDPQTSPHIFHQNPQSLLASQESHSAVKDSTLTLIDSNSQLGQPHDSQTYSAATYSQTNVGASHQQESSSFQQPYIIPTNNVQQLSPIITFNQHQPSQQSSQNAPRPQVNQAHDAISNPESTYASVYQHASIQQHSPSNIYQGLNIHQQQQVPQIQQQNGYDSLPSQPSLPIYQPPLIVPTEDHKPQYPQTNTQDGVEPALISQNIGSQQQQQVPQGISSTYAYKPTFSQQIPQPQVSTISQHSSPHTAPIALSSAPHQPGTLIQTNTYQAPSSYQLQQQHNEQQAAVHSAPSIQENLHQASTSYQSQPLQQNQQQQHHHYQPLHTQQNSDQQHNMQHEQQVNQPQSHYQAPVISTDSHQSYQLPLSQQSQPQQPLQLQHNQEQSQHQELLLQKENLQQQHQLHLQQQEQLKIQQEQQEQLKLQQQQQEQLKLQQQQQEQLKLQQQQQEQLKLQQQKQEQLKLQQQQQEYLKLQQQEQLKLQQQQQEQLKLQQQQQVQLKLQQQQQEQLKLQQQQQEQLKLQQQQQEQLKLQQQEQLKLQQQQQEQLKLQQQQQEQLKLQQQQQEYLKLQQQQQEQLKLQQEQLKLQQEQQEQMKMQQHEQLKMQQQQQEQLKLQQKQQEQLKLQQQEQEQLKLQQQQQEQMKLHQQQQEQLNLQQQQEQLQLQQQQEQLKLQQQQQKQQQQNHFHGGSHQFNSQNSHGSPIQNPAVSTLLTNIGPSLENQAGQIAYATSQQFNQASQLNTQQQFSVSQHQSQPSLSPQLQSQILYPYHHHQMLNSQPVHQAISQLQQDPNRPNIHSPNPVTHQQESLYRPPIQSQFQLPQNSQTVHPLSSDSSIRPNSPSQTSQGHNHHQMQQNFGVQPLQQTFNQANSAYPQMEQQHVFSIQNIQANPYASQQSYQQPSYGLEILPLNGAQVSEPVPYQGSSQIVPQKMPSVHQTHVPNSQHSYQFINAQHQDYSSSRPLTHHQVYSNQQNTAYAPVQASVEKLQESNRPLNTQTTSRPQQIMDPPSKSQQTFASHIPQTQELKPMQQHQSLESTRPDKISVLPIEQSYQTQRPPYVHQDSYVVYATHDKPSDRPFEIQDSDPHHQKDNIEQNYFSQSHSHQQHAQHQQSDTQADAVGEHILHTETSQQSDSNQDEQIHSEHNLMIEQVSSEPVIDETSPKPQDIPSGIKGRPSVHESHIHPLLRPTSNIKPPLSDQTIITQTKESDNQHDTDKVQSAEKVAETAYQQEDNFEDISQEKIHQDKETHDTEDYSFPSVSSNDRLTTEDESPVYYYDDDLQNSQDMEHHHYDDDDPSLYEQQYYTTDEPTTTTKTTTPSTTTEKRKTIRFTFSKRSPKPTKAMSQTPPTTITTSTTVPSTNRPDSQFEHQWFLNYQRDRTSTTLHPALQQHYQQHQHQQHQHQQHQHNQHNPSQFKPPVEINEHVFPGVAYPVTSSSVPQIQLQNDQQQQSEPQISKPTEQQQTNQHQTFHNSQNDTHLLEQEDILDDPSHDLATQQSIDQQQMLIANNTMNEESTISPIYLPTVSVTDYGVKKFSSNPLESSFACPTPHCNGYNCSLLRGSDGCQKCVCDSPCSPCPQHCVKTKTLADGRCPICDCTGPGPQKPIMFGTEKCSPVECRGQNCRQIKDSSGCPTCVCDPQCVIPKCDPGCEILIDVPAGQCPGCVCKVTVVQAVVHKRPCPTVSCSSPNCKEVRNEDGCAKCECGPACPPPKCDPGCSVQTDVAAGQCPTCVCSEYLDDDDDEEDEAYCPNLFCADYGCREIPGPAGCPICLCDPLCKTPVCEPGCEIVTNKYLGRCPVCICRSPNEAVSPGKNISKFSSEISSDQEPIMLQEEIPKYTTVSLDMQEEQQYQPQKYQPQQQQQQPQHQQDQHQYQHDQLELNGQHMIADETTTEEPTTTTTPKPTCPSPLCSGLRCQTTTDSNGCAVCKCKYPCPTPKCVGNCYAETNYPSHRCPGCVCPSRRKPPAY